MPAPAPSRSQILHATNERLRSCLDLISQHGGSASGGMPDCITALLSELSGAGAELRAHPIPLTGLDPMLDEELRQYRSNVELLRELLPSIHSQLSVERARLEVQRARMQSAAEWARASRQTL